MSKFPIKSLIMACILQVSHYKLGLPVVSLRAFNMFSNNLRMTSTSIAEMVIIVRGLP